MLQRRIVAVLHHRIVAPGQALGEPRLLGVVGQHAPERQVRLERARPPARRSARSAPPRRPERPPRAGAGCGPVRGSRSAAPPRRRAASESADPGPPPTGRPHRAVRPCPPRSAAGGTPGRARGSDGSAAPRSPGTAGRRRRSPAAAARAPRSAVGAACASCAVSPTLIIHTSTSERRPRGQHRIHLVGDEDQLAPHRHLRAYRVGVRRIAPPPGRNRFRRRTADCRDRGSSCARARPTARRRGSRPRAPPRTPPRAAARFARGSSRCR